MEERASGAVEVRDMVLSDVEVLNQRIDDLGWKKRGRLYRQYFEETKEGSRVVLVGLLDSTLAGYLTIRWSSWYRRFRENGIPEILDFNVFPPHRRQGIGTKLMDAAESLVFERCDECGIAVGLHPDYGAAQRLYVLRGYVPDAHGAQYEDRDVAPFETLPVDDNLVIYLTKRVSATNPYLEM